MTAPYNEGDTDAFYKDLFRPGEQSGGGIDVFSGRPVMGGDGLGSVLSGLARIVLPALKRRAINLGKRVLNAGRSIVGDIMRRDNVKQSLKRHFADTGTNLLGDVVGSMAPDVVKRTASTAPRAKKSSKKKKKNGPMRRAG